MDELDEMNSADSLLVDVEYWQSRANQARLQATSLSKDDTFAVVLLKHATDYERLARRALTIRQTRERMGKILPEFRKSDNLVPIRAGA